jgi:hypothetical protein
MRKLHFIAALILALAAAPYSPAQQPLLPERFGSWEPNMHHPDMHPPLAQPLVMWPRSREAASLDSHPEYTKLLVESGVVRVEERGYQKGGSELELRVFQLRDPSSAYEVYTSRISSEMHPSVVWGPSAIGNGHLLLLIGNMVVEIAGPENASTADLQQLVNIIKSHSDQTPLPPVRSYLPDGFSDGTQRYALGPVGFQQALNTLRREEYSTLTPEVGFANAAEAMLAEYGKGNESAVLVLIEYPTPQLAEQRLRHLEQAISPGAKQAGTTIERKASLLSLVLRPSSAAYAGALRGAVNYETEVTWNEPHQTASDPPLLTTVAKIFISTGVFMVVAVVLGVAFGGVRVLAKIFLPGKVFDRPEQMDVLQLGLSSKRIDSRDFY